MCKVALFVLTKNWKQSELWPIHMVKKDQTVGDTTTWRARNCVLWGERNSKDCILYDAIMWHSGRRRWWGQRWGKEMTTRPRAKHPRFCLLRDLQGADGSISRPVKWEGPKGRIGKVPSIWNMRRFILCFSSNSMNSLNLDLKPYLKKRLIPDLWGLGDINVRSS